LRVPKVENPRNKGSAKLEKGKQKKAAQTKNLFFFMNPQLFSSWKAFTSAKFSLGR
jgi:hypothetical protein